MLTLKAFNRFDFLNFLSALLHFHTVLPTVLTQPDNEVEFLCKENGVNFQMRERQIVSFLHHTTFLNAESISTKD